MTRRQRRVAFVLALLTGVGTAAILGAKAFKENLLYFVSPSEVVAGTAPEGRPFRLGGVVKAESVQRQSGSLQVTFVVTDYAKDVNVVFEGILPDLFREGQGVVTNGRLRPDGVFVASEVLAKHDENYMPPEVSQSLKAAHLPASPHSALTTIRKANGI